MVIDMHTHLWLQHVESDRELTLCAMDKYGIDWVYVSGLSVTSPNKEQVEAQNQSVYQFAKDYPDKVKGYVYISPEHDNAMDVLRRGIEDMGMIAVKLWVSTFCDDVCVNPIVEKAIDYGVPILLHSWLKAKPISQCEFETTGKHVANLARRYPEAKLIMAHLSGNCYDGIRAVRDLPNVWCDYSGSTFRQDDLSYAIEELGVDRLLHGSDLPGNYLVNLGQVLDLDISEEDKDKILYKNTLKLFDTNFRLGGVK